MKNDFENIEQTSEKNEIRIEELSFEELQKLSREVKELSVMTFKETENGFVNINGERIQIGEQYGKYVIMSLPDRIPDFHRHFSDVMRKELQNGFDRKEDLILIIREMIEEFGGRIIE